MNRMTKLAIFAALAGMTLPATGAARADWLSSNDSIRTLVSGKRVYLKIPVGGEFPLHYKTSGKVTGDGSAVGLGKFFAPRETGEWWVSDGQLCQRFPTWYEGRVHCFQLDRTGNNTLKWRRDDGYSGRARIQ